MRGEGRSRPKLRAALIGTGAIAREHLAALSKLPNVEVAGVCDLSAARAESMAERFEVRRWYTDHRRMLSEASPDLVHITTPPTSHFQLARDCLSSGFNVLCEKPITVEYAEFRELRQLAANRGRMLLENQNYRFNSTILTLRELVDSGELGEIADVQVQVFLDIGAPGSRFVDPNAPHPCLGMRGGAIADFLTHIAYLVYLFAGTSRVLRTAWSKRVRDSLLPVDEFRALLEGDRSMASVAFSANAQPNGFWVRVIGTKVHAETNLFEPPRLTLRRVRKGARPVMTFVDGVIESRDLFTAVVRGLWRKLGGVSIYDGLSSLVRQTYAALEEGGEAPVPIQEIDDVARLVEDFTRPELAS
jgi:predicted dehydrogenase